MQEKYESWYEAFAKSKPLSAPFGAALKILLESLSVSSASLRYLYPILDSKSTKKEEPKTKNTVSVDLEKNCAGCSPNIQFSH